MHMLTRSTLPAVTTIAALLSVTTTGKAVAFMPSAFVPHSSGSINSVYATTRSRVPVCTTSLSMSFFADSSDYKGEDFEDDAAASTSDSAFSSSSSEEQETPVTEHSPVPMSKNNKGNRWVAFVFDRALDRSDRDVLDLHQRRIQKTEDHVLFCRMANLYNETFNYNSMVDVLWSYPILSSDLHRTIGHAMCLDCPSLEEVRSFLSRDPINRLFASSSSNNEDDDDDNDLSEEEKEAKYLEIANSIPLYRWRQIRDHSLRMDDGRDGNPTLLLGLDRSAVIEESNKGKTTKKKKKAAGAPHPLRQEQEEDHLEYLIRSERVIAAGPLHLPTETKEDDASIPVGDLILFNAPTREEAIDFAENDPYAQVGLYQTLRVHRYNSLDVTGKFVSEDMMNPDRYGYQMKRMMEEMGYPVHDHQTQWINW